MENINTGVTQREIQVLKLIAAEYSSDEIAQQLFISSETVKSHRRNLLFKMEVKNTAGLVRRAFEQNLLRV